MPPPLLPGVAGPIGGYAADPYQGAVEHETGVAGLLRCAYGVVQLGGALCEQSDGLGDVSPGGGDTDAETGGDLGVGLALTQVNQGEKGLSSRGELAPACADGFAVAADHSGHVLQRAA